MDTTLTYIVTGCTGYVGNVLAKKLMSEGCRVVGLARSPRKVATVFGDDPPEVVFGDITDKDAVERLFAGAGPFAVLHTAAKVTIGEGDAAEAARISMEGTRNVVESCLSHGARKLLHISSSEVLPAGTDTEEKLAAYTPDPAAARAGYTRDKQGADAIVLSAVRERGLDASILMPACVLGPGDFSHGHMSQLLADFANGKLPASVRGGYNHVDIRDMAAVLPAIFERSAAGECYVFATSPSAINDFLRPVAALTGRKMPVTLPLWMAYAGLPFLAFGAWLVRKRPLYTRTALTAISHPADFPTDKTKAVFGFSPRPLAETVGDHVRFLVERGKIAPERLHAENE